MALSTFFDSAVEDHFMKQEKIKDDFLRERQLVVIRLDTADVMWSSWVQLHHQVRQRVAELYVKNQNLSVNYIICKSGELITYKCTEVVPQQLIAFYQML